uniref:Phosphoesterase, PA-phosphatase related n=1 Tax=Solibacter usitatus (strain Ellin6076) TaxID=234267 RepID=Q01PA0_SOLUE
MRFDKRGGLTRRLFLGAVGSTGTTCAAGEKVVEAEVSANERSREAYRIRVDAARLQRDTAQPLHPTNSDEQVFPSKIGNFSKGLPHNALGEVNTAAYQVLTQALTDRAVQSDIERVPMGSADPSRQMKFVDPCAGVCFELEGADSHKLSIRAAPGVTSAETAGEMVELYWQALARDVPFTEYASDAVTNAASAELTRISDFRGPKAKGAVTSQTLFRGLTNGDRAGPYVSQFLLKAIPFGTQFVEQRMRSIVPGTDYLIQYFDWLSAQNGTKPDQALRFDSTRRYIRNGRDLAQWVHIDVLYQAYFNAMLIMSHPPDPTDEWTGGGMGVPLNSGNPYRQSANQEGFGTFGGPAIATAVAESAARALKAVWYQKWFVHRRLRPEAYGGLVQNTVSSGQKYPLHSDVLNSEALSRIHSRYGSYLLPMAYPEGCPMHPSYGAGHATVAGASITILKSLFDENFVIPNPVVASPDGLSLIPYQGPDANQLTVGGELNKLAANVGLGRNFAGVHWRSDFAESVELGETLAISVLRDQRLTFSEQFGGSTFTLLDGTKITV